jgi:hypothetical protein
VVQPSLKWPWGGSTTTSKWSGGSPYFENKIDFSLYIYNFKSFFNFMKGIFVFGGTVAMDSNLKRSMCPFFFSQNKNINKLPKI